MRIVFMGTPDFSVAALAALMAAGHEICAVYTQPPRPAGRGKAVRPSPVHQFAENAGLPVRHPVSLKAPEEQAAFAALNADIAVVVAYGLILPPAVLDAPEKGCLNIHASLLPRWRGAAPIQRAIMAGDRQTGVCIMQMEPGLDTGPVLTRRETDITPVDTAASLHDRLAAIGAELIVRTLEQLPRLCPVAQSDEGVSYAHKIEKSETRIDWSRDAPIVDRHIRGLSPFPGAWTMFNGERIKCLRSAIATGSGAPGVTLTGDLVVACGTGAISLIQVQRAGKQAVLAKDLLRGFPISAGAKFD